jgi:probable rRNA maturation factor
MPDDPPSYVQVSQRDLAAGSRISLKFLRQIVRTTLSCASFSKPSEISLTLTHDAQIRRLNLEYREKDEPTDVLSFALQEGMDMPVPPGMAVPLGDIVVSWETIQRQASEHRVDSLAELGWAVSHGTLHLLGYDHQTPEQRAPMRALEIVVLDRLGLQKPVLV